MIENIENKCCLDVYGQTLKIGDIVIPVMNEALIIGKGGKISKIISVENNAYITLVDQNGNILLENVDSTCYTTQSRFEEMEDEKFVYTLDFFGDKTQYLTSIPLTSHTTSDFEVPDNAAYVSLHAEHLMEEKEYSDRYKSSDIYFFAVNGEVEFGTESNIHYLKVLNTGEYRDCITQYHKLFASKETLKSFLKNLIDYFHNSDLTCINNDIIYDQNKEKQDFEKKLILDLSTSKI